MLLVGRFLVLLHLVKLFEQRANRDYGQLLILSLLLMVAAAINTERLLFGVLFLAYLCLALYACVMFHLKVEADAARAAQTLPPEKLHAGTLRQDQRFLPRSMRRLTGLISVVSMATAVIVFLFFPRGAGYGMFGQLQFRPGDSVQAFSDTVQFQRVAKITQSNEVAAYVKVSKNGKPVEGTVPLVLRGVTLERYRRGKSYEGGGAWEHLSGKAHDPARTDGETKIFEPAAGDRWTQEVRLNPTGTKALFALPGVETFESAADVDVQYNATDQTFQTKEPLRRGVEYTVVSSNTLGTFAPWSATPLRMNSFSDIDPQIEAFARRPEVSGKVVSERVPIAFVDAHDAEISRNIEAYLRKNFSYTLDLTDAKSMMDGRDPLVVFLYDLKRGHCEYFAGAMALMCQSLGMQARMVVGYHVGAEDYSSFGNMYIVRQSHAHAWVEVLTRGPDGINRWESFDPTSGNMADVPQNKSLWQSVKQLFSFLEYQWASSVVAYDADRRDSLLNTMDQKLTNSAYRAAGAMDKARGWWSHFKQWLDSAASSQFWSISTSVLTWAVGMALLGLVAAIGYFVYERWKIGRRAQRIGLDHLPAADRLRLARQLGFYEELMQLLGRHHITRRPDLTPREFSESLSFLPAEAYTRVKRLTHIFYRIRFGEGKLQPAQQRRLSNVVAVVAQTMARIGGA